MSNIHIIDITIVTVYIIVCILIGLYRYKSVKTLKEYALGISRFPSIVIVTTFLMTAFGATQVIGCITEVYVLGVFFAIVCLFVPITWLLMAVIYSRSIEQFRGCISLSDIMEMLYGKVGRWVANIASLLISTGVVVMQITAVGHIMHYLIGLGYAYSIIVSASVICIYSIFGGIRAVAITDVFQFTILIVALPIAFSFAYHDIGGYRGIVNSLPSNMITVDINKDNVFLFLSLILYSLFPNVDGVDIQRALMSRNSTHLAYCMNIVAIMSMLFLFVLCIIGFILKIKLPDMDPNIVFIHFIANHAAVGFKGLIIAGLLAIAMSTADAYINYTSVICTHDVLRRIINLTEKQALLAARMFTFLFTFFICIISILLVTRIKRLLEIEWFIVNLTTPLILTPLIAGFLKFRTNSKSFISATIIAISFTMISGYIVGALGTISSMCGMIGSIIGLFGMHYLQVYRGTLSLDLLQSADKV